MIEILTKKKEREMKNKALKNYEVNEKLIDCYDADELKKLIEAGADIDYQCGANGETLLMRRAYYTNIIKLLLEAGAKVDIEDDNGLTALDYACKEKYNDTVVKLLIEAGAKYNGNKDNKGFTALDHACRNKLVHSAKALIRAGAEASEELRFACEHEDAIAAKCINTNKFLTINHSSNEEILLQILDKKIKYISGSIAGYKHILYPAFNMNLRFCSEIIKKCSMDIFNELMNDTIDMPSIFAAAVAVVKRKSTRLRAAKIGMLKEIKKIIFNKSNLKKEQDGGLK